MSVYIILPTHLQVKDCLVMWEEVCCFDFELHYVMLLALLCLAIPCFVEASLMYGLTPSLRTFRVCATHGAIAIEDSEDRRQRQARKRVQRKRRWLATQQRYERRQDNSDRRRLAHQNLLTA